jgi:hypothetical protein
MKQWNRQPNKRIIPEYKNEDYQMLAYMMASDIVMGETDKTFRRFQKSFDKQLERLLNDAKR